MATPEQIAYRRLLERKALAAKQRKFENHCKYILGGTMSRRLRVSGWDELEAVREFLRKTNNLDKIEEYLRMKGVGMDDNNGVPEIGKSENFDKWVRNLVKETAKEEFNKKIRGYLSRNREFIRLGLSKKILGFKDLAEKLSAELECRVTAKKVQVVWYDLLREERKQTTEDSQDSNNSQERGSEASVEFPPEDNSQEKSPDDSAASAPEEDSQKEISENSTQEQNPGDSDTFPSESRHQEQEEIILRKR